eukprot:COSAG06_NODE_2700_length_6427_cov_6.031448_3_plen_35_part_00
MLPNGSDSQVAPLLDERKTTPMSVVAVMIEAFVG